MNRKMCPACKREVIVFEPRDIEGGFFYKHKSANGVECWWSLRAYPAEHHAHLTPESLATSQAVVNTSALEPSDGDTSPAQAQVA